MVDISDGTYNGGLSGMRLQHGGTVHMFTKRFLFLNISSFATCLCVYNSFTKKAVMISGGKGVSD